MPNEPSFVSPNVIGHTLAFSVMSNTNSRPSGWSMKWMIRVSSMIFTPSGGEPLVLRLDARVVLRVLLRLADLHDLDRAVPRSVRVLRLAPEIDPLVGLVRRLDLQLDALGDHVAVAEPRPISGGRGRSLSPGVPFSIGQARVTATPLGAAPATGTAWRPTPPMAYLATTVEPDLNSIASLPTTMDTSAAASANAGIARQSDERGSKRHA